MSMLESYLIESSQNTKQILQSIIDCSFELQSIVKPNESLEDWIRVKVTNVLDYLNSVIDYKNGKQLNEINHTRTTKLYFILHETYTYDMTIRDLKNIHSKAITLNQIINPTENLDDWTLSKLMLSLEYLNDVKSKSLNNSLELNEINFKQMIATGTLLLSTLLPISADSYVIQKGDTLSKIANSLGLSVSDLIQLNKGIDPNKLKIGQIINVSDDISNVYVIQKGDSLSSIASKIGIDLAELVKLNASVDPRKLQIGMKINLPDNNKVNSIISNFKKSDNTRNPGELYSSEFIQYIKHSENGISAGYDKSRNKWYPHKSPEGGTDTIGYGHKLTRSDQSSGKYRNGLSTKEIHSLLISDLKIAENRVKKDIAWISAKKGTTNYKLVSDKSFDDLSSTQKQMLIDFAFNLGSLRSFPTFLTAVLNDDIDMMKKQYKRYYGKGKELTQRNTDFYNLFLKNYE